MSFFDALLSSYPQFLSGLMKTLELTAIALVFSVILGVLVLSMKLSKLRPVGWIANGYLALVRGIPLITLMFVIYFGIVAVVKVDAFTAAAVGLSVHSSAYMAEIFRSGLTSVPSGQSEAARSLGMSKSEAMRTVVAPQAIRVIVPALVNQAIITLKDSSVAAFITVAELFLTAQQLAAATFEPLTYYTIVSIYYLVIVGIMTMISRRVEQYYAKKS